MRDAVVKTMKNIGIELIDYRHCTIHPVTDDRKVRRMVLS